MKKYAAIDLKSFYASVECVDRGLDPLRTNLVVADSSRTDKTICLAVSPALKSFGVSGRPRLFEVNRAVQNINIERKTKAPGGTFSGKSSDIFTLKDNPSLSLDFIIAPPRMSHYMEISGKIYSIYLHHISEEDIHVYSIDEVFIDLTDYIKSYKLSAKELTVKLIQEIYQKTGITATAGIGTNLYLAKVAMDIEAKHSQPDENGARIAELDEISYRKKLWAHRPITDFWRIGHGYAKRLSAKGLYTMGDIAKCSLGKETDYYNEDLLYNLFGINAELLIDHAWGCEPCTIADIKSYKSQNNSISSGQVLMRPYTFEEAKTVVREMTDSLALDLVEKGLVTDQVILTISYDSENLSSEDRAADYSGAIKTDRFGRIKPQSSHGSKNVGQYTSSGKYLSQAMIDLYESIADKKLLSRNIYVVFNHVISKNDIPNQKEPVQPDLFTDYSLAETEKEELTTAFEKEERLQKSIISLHKKFGKNSVLKGLSLTPNSTQKERNEQIGGHRS